MSKNDKALHAIRVAKSAVDQELERHRVGSGTVSSPQQLASINEQLDAWEREVVNGAIKPRQDRDRGMGHMISDSWPLSSPLGELVLKAEEAYVTL